MAQKSDRTNTNFKKSKYRSAARRSAKSRKVRVVLLYTVVITVIIAISVALSLTVLFKVENINVTGLTKYDSKDIISDSGIFVGENIFLCGRQSISNKLEIDYPYIENVEVDKKIPNTVNLKVTEATPVGYVQYGGKNAVISTKGKILDMVAEPPQNLAVIKGVDVQEAQLAQTVQFTDKEAQTILRDVLAAIQAQGVSGTTGIDVTNHSNPKMVYQARITIEFGNPVNINEKLKSAMAIINDPSVSNTARGVIDASMSVENNRTYFQQDYTT